VSNDSSYPSLPKVDILYTMREFDGQLVLDCLKNGAKGIVIGGTGNGGLPNGSKQVEEALAMGLMIVVGSRSPFGPSSPNKNPTYAKSGYIHLPQSRIMLQLAIASSFDQNQASIAIISKKWTNLSPQIIELFESSLRKAINQPFIY
jgi:L-asparaginase